MRVVPDAIRVVLVDHHSMVLQGMANLIAGEPDMEVVATAGCLDEFVLRVVDSRRWSSA